MSVTAELHPGQVTNDKGHGLWRVFRPESVWRLIWAPTAERAMKRVRNATHARPVRPSSWHQQQKAAGLVPKPKPIRRRRG